MRAPDTKKLKEEIRPHVTFMVELERQYTVIHKAIKESSFEETSEAFTMARIMHMRDKTVLRVMLTYIDHIEARDTILSLLEEVTKEEEQ